MINYKLRDYPDTKLKKVFTESLNTLQILVEKFIYNNASWKFMPYFRKFDLNHGLLTKCDVEYYI